eukprot:UN02670
MAMPSGNNNNINNGDKVERHHDGTQTVVKPNGYSYTRRSIFAGSSLGAANKRGMSYSSSTASLIPTNTSSNGHNNNNNNGNVLPGMISNNNSTTDNNSMNNTNDDQKR